METELTLKLDRAIINSAKKYPPLIQQLSGIISETDLERIYRDDEKVRYILRDGRIGR
jgi:hypothetical protein